MNPFRQQKRATNLGIKRPFATKRPAGREMPGKTPQASETTIAFYAARRTDASQIRSDVLRARPNLWQGRQDDLRNPSHPVRNRP